MTSKRHGKVKDDARAAVERGDDVQSSIRDITLKALSGGGLDTAALREVAKEVSEGVQLGLERHGHEARSVLEKAFAGLDEAFAKAAEATTLALQEASGNTRDFVKADLSRRVDELKTLEEMYLDSVRQTAKQGRDFVASAARQFADHAVHNGTAVGRQVQQSLTQLAPLTHIAEEQFKQGVKAGVEASALFARAAAGFLAGIADRLETQHRREPGKGH